MTVAEWVEAYARAWREKDADAVVRLFTEDAEYRSSPFREPGVGSDGIRAYWERATSTQEDVDVRTGAPLLDGDRVAVEWWTTMRDGGEWFTLPGCLLLRFAPDGRCRALREYWHLEPGRHEPHPGWGA
ncbi:MAG TPA: nuclear transport factor 2 family protein [Gaiellaceae bacterium]|nr:nuclear transport factor 2 family protein [Gaiellaceae bacterium]